MTNRERVLAAYKWEPVDFIPFIGRFHPLTPVQRNGVWNFAFPPVKDDPAKVTWPNLNGMVDVDAMLDYLKEIPFDVIFGVDPTFPGVDMKKIKNELGDRFAFDMGPNNTDFHSDDTEDVRRTIRRLADVFGKTGFILSPSVSLHSIMPWRNFEAAVDEWKKIR